MRYFLISLFLLLGLTGCTVGPRQIGLSPAAWQKLSSSEKKSIQNNYKIIQIANAKMPLIAKGPKLKVTIIGGQAKFPPHYALMTFEPLSFSILPGTCQSIGMRATPPSNALTLLKACYSNNILFFDPSKYNQDQQQATMYIPFQRALWKRGMTYKDLSSEGFVGLSHVNVTVQIDTTK